LRGVHPAKRVEIIRHIFADAHRVDGSSGTGFIVGLTNAKPLCGAASAKSL
jgi:hypothetical protein